MREASFSKYLCRRIGLLCALCISQLFPMAVRAQSAGSFVQNYDFSGVWNFNGFVSAGPGAPWAERGTLTVASDGSFTGSAAQANGALTTPSGAFQVSSSGIEMSLNGQSATSLCMTDSNNSIMTCTATLSDGSSGLMVLSRQPASISLADLAGAWQGGRLSSSPTASWETLSEVVKSDGTFTGSCTKSDGTTVSTSGALAISSTGMVTCRSGCSNDPKYASFVNPSATVMVGTSGAATSNQDANLFVLTKQTSSYSINNLVGVWELSSVASGPGGPWWENGLLLVNPNGSCLLAATKSDGSTVGQNGTVSISSSGFVTVSLDTTATGYIDPNMDVMVLTNTWSDGETHQLSILTNATSTMSSSPTVTMSSGNTTSPSTSSSSSPSTSGSSSSESGFGASGAKPAAGAAGSLKKVGDTGPQAAGAKTSTPDDTTAAPVSAAPSAGPSASSPQPVPAGQAPAPASAPGPPTIVVVTPGDSRALVNFKLPAHNGGRPITQCTVTANPGGVKVSRVGSPIRIPDLKNGTSYTFKVTAANMIGTGPASTASNNVTVGRVPHAPRIGTIKAGKGRAVVSFTPAASNGGGDITSYTVTSSSGQKASGPASPITVKGLSGGTSYTFTVTAANETGSSPPSKASGSVTLP